MTTVLHNKFNEAHDPHTGQFGIGNHLAAVAVPAGIALLSGALAAGASGAVIGAALAIVIADAAGGFVIGSKIVGLFGKEKIPQWAADKAGIKSAEDYLKALKAHLLPEDWQRLCKEIIPGLSEDELIELAQNVVDAFPPKPKIMGPHTMNNYFAPLEVKLNDKNAALGIFSGYGAVFGNVDSHGDVIKEGAFSESIKQRKAEGRPIPMHLMHRVYGGDGLPVGVWTDLSEDNKGLKVEGKISGMNTDGGRLLFERVKDGALGGLSIGYSVKPNGSVLGKKGSDAKRTLINLELKEISLVDSPSNALSRVDYIKSEMMDEIKELMKVADVGKATAATIAALQLHTDTMSGGDSPSVDEREQLRTHLYDIHEALTGQRVPAGMKSLPTTIRELETFLREECKFSHAQARSFVENGFKVISPPRDEGNDTAKNAADFLALLK